MTQLSAEELVENFQFFDDWEDRYRYIIDLGRKLPPMDEADKSPATKVDGCVSQVWLVPRQIADDPPRLSFSGDSDAAIVKGLIAILLSIYSDRPAAEILRTDARAILSQLDLEQHLSPSRSNGLFAMVRRIRELAAEQMAAS